VTEQLLFLLLPGLDLDEFRQGDDRFEVRIVIAFGALVVAVVIAAVVAFFGSLGSFGCGTLLIKNKNFHLDIFIS
jgi:hypothetical protein